MARGITVADRRSIELFGPGDVIARPEDEGDLALLAIDETWDVLDPLRVALLDARFVEQALARHPELIGAVLARFERQTNRVAINLAIVHHQRVDVRVLRLLWGLAGRWGRLHGNGMLVPFRLRHAMLADLVAARRQAVTTALGSLSVGTIRNPPPTPKPVCAPISRPAARVRGRHSGGQAGSWRTLPPVRWLALRHVAMVAAARRPWPETWSAWLWVSSTCSIRTPM